ncbi:hypothetical protein [Amnibacterium kyonggiense]
MTMTATIQAGPPADQTVCWRALDSGIWVARRSGRHLGSIERGRRWTAAGPEGEPLGAFRSLREAQAAVADPEAHRAPVRRGPSGASVAPLVALGLAAVASASGWALTSLLA